MDIIDRLPVCDHCRKSDISPDLVSALEILERLLERELTYTSGVRCVDCNRVAGGAANSAHLRGLAADVYCESSTDLFLTIKGCILAGVRRLGVGKNFIHVDVDQSLSQMCAWSYGGGSRG